MSGNAREGDDVRADGPLWVRRHEDVVLSPAFEASNPLGFEVAAHTRAGVAIPDFAFRRGRYVGPAPRFRRPWTRTIGTPHLYGGVMMPHYGHFLLESLSRLWAAKAFPDLPIVWQLVRATRRPKPWQMEVLDIAGIDRKRIVLLRRPMAFRTLLDADQGVRLNRFFHPAQIAALASYPFREPNRSKRVWLSRSRLPGVAGRVVDEIALEARLAGIGWTIVYPEQLTVREQLVVMADAWLLAGFIGSAFHTVVLGRDVQTKLRLLRRYNDRIPAVYDLIAGLKGIDQRFIDLKLEALNQTNNSAMSISRLSDPGEIDRIIEELND